MVDQSAMIQVFADYAATIARHYDIGDVLYRIADQVVGVLGIDGAGVSIVATDGELQFVSATDEDVVRIEEAQIRNHEGPCQDAFSQQELVTSGNLLEEDRWPEYRKVAIDRGCRAVAGVPMAVEDHRIGALNMYHRQPRHWSAEELRVGRILADMATGYILNAVTLSASAELAKNLEHALSSRVVIEQAKGILVERHQIGSAAAFDRLRAHARNTRQTIHEISSAVIEGRLDP